MTIGCRSGGMCVTLRLFPSTTAAAAAAADMQERSPAESEGRRLLLRCLTKRSNKASSVQPTSTLRYHDARFQLCVCVRPSMHVRV